MSRTTRTPTLSAAPGSDAGPFAATDGELLAQFRRSGDAAAFQRLVERHGPMVWSVCRRVLRNDHDAEDAFQATLLALAHHAAAVRTSSALAGWLYRVALRTAVRARRRRLRRRETPLGAEPPTPAEAAFPDFAGQHAVRVLMEELAELPERFRTPLVMRHLEGRSRGAIAEANDVTIATVQGRLARGARLLRSRLLRRGVSLSVAAAALASPDRAAAGPGLFLLPPGAPCAPAFDPSGASPAAVSLCNEGVRAMLVTSIGKPPAAAAAVLLLVAAPLVPDAVGEGPAGGGATASADAGDAPLVLSAAVAPSSDDVVADLSPPTAQITAEVAGDVTPQGAPPRAAAPASDRRTGASLLAKGSADADSFGAMEVSIGDGGKRIRLFAQAPDAAGITTAPTEKPAPTKKKLFEVRTDDGSGVTIVSKDGATLQAGPPTVVEPGVDPRFVWTRPDAAESTLAAAVERGGPHWSDGDENSPERLQEHLRVVNEAMSLLVSIAHPNNAEEIEVKQLRLLQAKASLQQMLLKVLTPDEYLDEVIRRGADSAGKPEPAAGSRSPAPAPVEQTGDDWAQGVTEVASDGAARLQEEVLFAEAQLQAQVAALREFQAQLVAQKAKLAAEKQRLEAALREENARARAKLAAERKLLGGPRIEQGRGAVERPGEDEGGAGR